jgi:hypothetical protein
MADQAHVLQAKVEVLESIGVWLVMRELQRQPDAISAAEKMCGEFRKRVEKQAAKMASTPVTQQALVIGLEVMESFFDRVKAAVSEPPSQD